MQKDNTNLRNLTLNLIFVFIIGGLLTVPLLLNVLAGQTLLRYNTRLLRLTVLCLSVVLWTRYLVPFRVFIRCLTGALIVPVFWIAAYSYVLFFAHNRGDFIGYYSSSLLLFSLLLSFNVVLMLSKIQRKVIAVKWLYWLILSFLYLLPCIYLGYYLIYGTIFNDFALIAILETNIEELVDYLLTVFSTKTLFLTLSFLAFSVYVLKIAVFWSTYSPISTSRKKTYIALFILVVLMFPLITYRKLFFPVNHYKNLMITGVKTGASLYSEMRDLKGHLDKNTSSLVLKNNETSFEKGTFLIIIGESASRDWMSAFNPKLRENNTPWEKDMRRNKSLVFFDNAYANAPITSLALTFALTSANQYNGIRLADAVSVIDIAQKAGYTTYWYSTQSKGSIHDGSVVTVASRADHVEWLKGYDEVLLKKLKEIPPNQKSVVFLHLSGSHYRYKSRYPEKLVQRFCPNLSQPYKEYKSSLTYTDYVLRSVFEYAQSHLDLKAMAYFSDHAEDMEFQHTVAPFRFSMIRIPFWVYCSQDYAYCYPETVQNLKKASKSVFTNDLFFDFFAGLLHIDSNHYLPQYDITSAHYSVTLKNALSQRGAVKISDDPALKKRKKQK